MSRASGPRAYGHPSAPPAMPWFVRWFSQLPSRFAIPLMVVFLVLPVRWWINTQSWESARHGVVQAAQATLLDRLHLEQTRLEAQLGTDIAQGLSLGARRLVSAWGLYPGITHAWLVDSQGRVQASLSRRDLGKQLDALLLTMVDPDLAPAWALHHHGAASANATVHAAHTHVLSDKEPVLLGHVSVYPGHHLLVQVDVSETVARAWNIQRVRMVRETAAVLLLLAFASVLIHFVWIRRMEHLKATATALGQGDWLARSGMREPDELGGIGQALDRMANTLQQQHQHLHTVANASPALLWTSGLDKGCDWFNERWLCFTGRSMAQELGNGWTEGVHPDDRQHCLSVYSTSFDARQPFTMEYRLRRHDGQYRWVLDQALPRFDVQGVFVGFIGSCLDITETKALEAQLLAQSDYFRVLVERATSFIAVLDTEGRRLYANPAYRQLLGEERAQLGQLFWDDVHLDDRATLRRVFEETVRTGVGQTARFRLKTAQGEVRHLSSHGGVIRLPDGRVSQVVVVSHDVTAQAQAEEHLLEVNARLEQRVAERTAELQAVNQSLESFVYSVSHDLKAPLRGVDGYSRLLEDDHLAQLDDDGRLFVRRIRSGVHHMEQLIDDLLAYSRMERRNLDMRPLSLAVQIRDALAFSQAAIQAQHVTVSSALDDAVVWADATGLALVLRNLLGNAVKFSAHATPPHIEVGCQSGNGVALVWVRDNGVGFDMKYHDRIFEMFQRLHRQEAFEGTGIGLAMVKKAMERMHGRVWADSQPGAGATFWLELPLANGAPVAPLAVL
ncbi:MAG: PAS domain S-box protein [Hydrogenophaga sp.]|uniref:PAS domain S-box protein n=1 Tax=Hydrogenophaga sp. TaxID=1904254 RepID=UPI0027694275|nr:PAS domain S-box protein [Hydrogenophaga sp.]MDP2418004.1 PAS domain S-box protein [Hydrogenophaga sp.]MDZ4187181.1 PAS domain S-box protein [Hydrogenophaga sp.]